MNSIINRRVFFRVAATGLSGCMTAPMELFPQSVSVPPVNVLDTAKYCIFILLAGAPSHTDTFDLKVGPWTPSDFVPATINGLDWPDGILPKLGVELSRNRLAVVRSCQSPALVHSLQQNWSQTGRSPSSALGKIAPNIGSIIALEKQRERTPNQPVPGFLSLNSGGSVAGPGYLPGRYSAFDFAPNATGIPYSTQFDAKGAFVTRYNMLQAVHQALGYRPAISGKFEETEDFYASASAMMYDNRVTSAFSFTPADSLRYGNSLFGQSCLTARNVLKGNLGVRFIQINLNGWDHHVAIYAGNGMYTQVRQLDSGLSALIGDLASLPGSRGTLLDDTLIVVKGEFGRVPGPLNSLAGRDHYFNHSALVAGGGVRGGKVIGSTNKDGSAVDDPGWSLGRPIYSEDFAATIYSAMGINYRTTRYDDPLGVGFQYVGTTLTNYIGEPITELFR